MSTPNDTFASIDPTLLEAVAGAASRAAKGDDSLNAMLTQITSSIKDLANQNNKGSDPMQLMLMMLMLGGGGGGGGGVVAGPGASPIINVQAAVGGCRRRGKKGW
ncbi:MAG: hypothetical protein M4D80_34695 [Myxococcota bacterium]|nr:hypothetical protein [Deltaproteobacteria bacterium]MDQ3340337.1 hypothetical protein [Myxococcota bacterium]